MRKSETAVVAASFVMIAIWITCVIGIFYGWVVNILHLVEHGLGDPVGVEAVLRIVGVVLVPIGAVMGWVA